MKVPRLIFLLLLSACLAHAEVLPAPLFGNHMVLQRDQTLPIWGTDTPGTAITVSFAGQNISTKTDAEGNWKLELKAIKAGGPYEMAIKGSSEVHFDDILLGDVWLASGQSNMEFELRQSLDADKEIPKANHPQIRFFITKRKASREPVRTEGQWQVSTPETSGLLSGVAYFFARDVYEKTQIPIGIIQATWGGTRAETWTSKKTLLAEPIYRQMSEDWEKHVSYDAAERAVRREEMDKWKVARAEALKNGTQPPPQPRSLLEPQDPNTPGILYQSMIEPLAPYPLRGVIWYQGEHNTNRPAAEYKKLLPLLITDWRTLWNEKDLPFLYVQLPNFEAGGANDTNWAELRDAPLQTLNLPNTGMAVTIDLGDSKDIHPRKKKEIGQRLAFIALSQVYGKDVPFSGPMFKKATARNETFRVQFDFAEGLTGRNGELVQGFELAGADGIFFPASVKIEGTSVILSTSEVKQPTQARYAFRNDPTPPPNLINVYGLPAPTFQTHSPLKD